MEIKMTTTSKKFWNKLLGEDLVQKLCILYPDIAQSLQDINITKKAHIPTNSNSSDIFSSPLILPHDIMEMILSCLHGIKDDFMPFYKPFILWGCDNLHKRINDYRFCEKRIYNDFIHLLFKGIDLICIRILLRELSQYNAEYEKYTNFCIELKNADFTNKIIQKYPPLQHLLFNYIENKAILFGYVINQYSSDKISIEKTLFNKLEIGKICSIQSNLSDAHHRGKEVLKLKTTTGNTIIYKPHSLENEQWFNNFAYFLGKSCSLPMYYLKSLSYSNYGWCETIEYKDCNISNEVDRYYKRIGIYLFVAYLLGTNDVHFQNLIASGEYPVLIDLECFSRPTSKKEDLNNDSNFLYLKLKNSVISSGILPQLHWRQETSGVDLSALSGGNADVAPFKIPVVIGRNTENVHIEYICPKITPQKNKPRLNGKMISLQQYEKQILRGFQDAYIYSMSHSAEINKWLSVIINFKSRYLIEETQKYNLLLRSSYHPNIMGNSYERELFFYSLWKHRNCYSETDKFITSSEVKDLINQDIPYFYFVLDSQSLFDSYGNKLSSCFTYSALDNIYKKYESLCLKDLNFQSKIISISVNPYGEKKLRELNKFNNIREVIKSPTKKAELLKAANAIGEKLLSEAIYDTTLQKVTWISFDIFDSKPGAVNIRPCSLYLYDGISGFLLFFHLLFHYLGQNRYKKIINLLETQLFDYTDSIINANAKPHSTNSGIYNGEASIVYLYLILFWTTKKKIYLEYAINHSSILVTIAKLDQNNDLLYGKAGAILVFCYLFQTLNDKKYLDIAEEIAVFLINACIKTKNGIGWKYKGFSHPLLGMAHGNAGIIIALAKLYQLTKKQKYYKYLHLSIKYEDNNFNESLQDWKDFRNEKHLIETEVAWCHGSGGILLSRIIVSKIVLDKHIDQICTLDIKRATHKICSKAQKKSLCLCHGECGIRLILRYALQKKFPAIRTTPSLIDSIYINEWYNPGLMNGYSGIGYYLVTLYCDSIPDYLFLTHDFTVE